MDSLTPCVACPILMQIHSGADMVTYAVRIREVHGVGRVDVTNEFFAHQGILSKKTNVQ